MKQHKATMAYSFKSSLLGKFLDLYPQFYFNLFNRCIIDIRNIYCMILNTQYFCFSIPSLWELNGLALRTEHQDTACLEMNCLSTRSTKVGQTLWLTVQPVTLYVIQGDTQTKISIVIIVHFPRKEMEARPIIFLPSPHVTNLSITFVRLVSHP